MILEALLGVSFLLVNTIYIFIVKSSLLNDERFYLMARVILYISNDVYDKVNAIVEQRRHEGARDKDISLSGTASMLLELGLRV
ncbi:relaxosome protein TraM, partial [Escherichia coli]